VAWSKSPLAGFADKSQGFQGSYSLSGLQLLNKTEHRPILFRQKTQKMGLYKSNTNLSLGQWPGICFSRRQKALFFSVLALYVNLLAILMPELCWFGDFLVCR
jgi:hypothetical protein